MGEKVQPLAALGAAPQKREDVISHLEASHDGIGPYGIVRRGRGRGHIVLVECRDFCGVVEMRPVEHALRDKSAPLIAEIRRPYQHLAAAVGVFAVLGERVAERSPVVAAQTQPEATEGPVVDAEGPGIAVGYVEFVRGSGSALNEILRTETVGIQTGKKQKFIRPVPRRAENLNARFVPGAGQQRILALLPVGGEIFGREMVGIGKPHRNYDHTRAQLECRAETLL